MKPVLRNVLFFMTGVSIGIGFSRAVSNEKLVGYFKELKSRFVKKQVENPASTNNEMLDKHSSHQSSDVVSIGNSETTSNTFDILKAAREECKKSGAPLYTSNNEEESNDSVKANDISGTTSGESWSEDDSARVSEFLYGSHSFSESDETIGENLVLLDTSDNDEIVQDGDVEEISPLDFVKAVANGEEMQSYIFEPATQTIHWNFTDEPLSEEDMKTAFGKAVVDSIQKESDQNPVHWIRPKYLYNKRKNVYCKIESGYYA